MLSPHGVQPAQVGYVKGIDLSPGEIAEAKVRYQQVLKKYGAPATPPSLSLLSSPLSSPLPTTPGTWGAD